MRIKKVYILIGCLFLISIMWLLSSWQASIWQKSIEQPTRFQPFNKILDSPVEKDYEEFISPDGKLKMTYPANWLILKETQFLETTIPDGWKEKYNLSALFLAQYFEAEGFAQLIIYQGNFNISIEEIIEEMKKSNEAQGWEVAIVKSDIKEKECVFEAKYLIPNNPTLYSKEVIFTGEGTNTYFISFVSLEESWPNFEEQADLILQSIEINS